MKDYLATLVEAAPTPLHARSTVREYLQARYGDFVLYDPPFKPGTWLLWLGPVAFGVIGLLVLLRILRPAAPVQLSEADQARVKDILEGS